MDRLILLLARGGGLGLAQGTGQWEPWRLPLTALLLVREISGSIGRLRGLGAAFGVDLRRSRTHPRLRRSGRSGVDEIIAVPMCFLGVFAS